MLSALTGLAATGQTLLVLMGGFDLSVASFIVAGALLSTQLRQNYHVPFGVGVFAAVAGAAAFGAMAGQICHRFEINPLIVTLAIGTIAVGLVVVITSGGDTYAAGGSAPLWLSTLTSPATTTLGLNIPPLVVIWVAVMLLMAAFLFHRTVLGRELLATGANPTAAEYSLIRTRRCRDIRLRL